MSILVIAAHPDDEILGCGGTIAKLAAADDVDIAILGEGLTARYQDREVADPRTLHELRAQAQEAARLVGARSISLGGLPDNRFDQVPLLEVVKLVESLVQRLGPSTVFTHHPGDLNVDHRLTFEATLTATRPLPGAPVQDLYTFEIASSTEWAFQQIAPTFKPNVFVNVTRTIDTKIRCMETYAGEIRGFPHPRSAEGLRISARRWGAVAGFEYAEAFELTRSLRA